MIHDYINSYWRLPGRQGAVDKQVGVSAQLSSQ